MFHPICERCQSTNCYWDHDELCCAMCGYRAFSPRLKQIEAMGSAAEQLHALNRWRLARQLAPVTHV